MKKYLTSEHCILAAGILQVAYQLVWGGNVWTGSVAGLGAAILAYSRIALKLGDNNIWEGKRTAAFWSTLLLQLWAVATPELQALYPQLTPEMAMTITGLLTSLVSGHIGKQHHKEKKKSRSVKAAYPVR